MSKTFLRICQQVAEDAGIAGKLSSVTGQTGEFLRVVNWVKRANTEIDGLWFNWNYLHTTHAFITIKDVRDYPAPVDHNYWDIKTFKIPALETNLLSLSYTRHKVDPSTPVKNQPSIFTVLPSQSVRFIDIPDDAYGITADYWRKSKELVNNDDEPRIPETFRDIIVYKALSYYANYESADEVKVQAIENYAKRLDQLQSRELPDFKGSANLQSGSDIQVSVPYDDFSDF